jgi:hypothetical protein
MSQTGSWEAPDRSRASRLLPVALLLLGAVAVGWLLRGADAAPAPEGGGLAVEEDASGTDTAEADRDADPASDPLPGAGGRWLPLEAAPVAAPRRHHSVWAATSPKAPKTMSSVPAQTL